MKPFFLSSTAAIGLIQLTSAVPASLSLPSFAGIPSFTNLPASSDNPSIPGGWGSSSYCWFLCASSTPTATSGIASPAASETPAATSSAVQPITDATDSGYNGGASASDVAGNTGCRALTFIFARGTSESGNMGTVIGPPQAKALQSAVGKSGVSVQGLNYAADAAGNANLGASGGSTLAKVANQALSACPSTKLVISGYSQGAMVIHNALSNGLDGSKVAAITVFGDPLSKQSFAGVSDKSKIKSFCASGDTLCESGGFAITPAHLTYGNNAQEAATFILRATGLKN